MYARLHARTPHTPNADVSERATGAAGPLALRCECALAASVHSSKPWQQDRIQSLLWAARTGDFDTGSAGFAQRARPEVAKHRSGYKHAICAVTPSLAKDAAQPVAHLTRAVAAYCSRQHIVIEASTWCVLAPDDSRSARDDELGGYRILCARRPLAARKGRPVPSALVLALPNALNRKSLSTVLGAIAQAPHLRCQAQPKNATQPVARRRKHIIAAE